jgi:hypothetical protein
MNFIIKQLNQYLSCRLINKDILRKCLEDTACRDIIHFEFTR